MARARGWRLSAAQWDLLTEATGLGTYPSPIQVQSHGRNALERGRVRAEVRAELKALGLMRAGRVDADLEAVLRLLHRPASWLDSVWLPDAAADQPVRVLAARGDAVGVCAMQHPDRSGATMLDVIPPTELAAEVVSRLPAHPPGHSPAVTVALAPSPDRLPWPDGDVRVSASCAWSSNERDSAAVSAILDQPHERAGRVVANVRDSSGQVRRSPVLRWCDNPDGRYQITFTPRSDDSRSLTVTPCDPHRLGEAIQRLLTMLDS
jgi:hypothetical protein